MEDSMNDLVTRRPIVYKKRWYIVLVLSWLNLSNGMIWISYATISDKTAQYYGITVENINWFSMVFPIVTIFFGMPTFWALDKMGIRISFNICALLNLLAATFRLLCAYDSVSVKNKFTLAMIGQMFGAFAQPIAMFSPARVASVWFAPEQRATATTLSALGNPLGILLGSILPPFILSYPRGFANLALVIFALSLIGALFSCLGICRSAPSRLPAISADRPALSHGFTTQLCLCASNCQFIILTIVFGMALGIFSTLSTLLEQILCPYGYSSTFAGFISALMIGCGLVGALVSGIVADRTKALTEIIQICYILAVIGSIAFSMLSVFPDMNIPILISVCWIGTFGVALYSIAIELAAEITFPVSENISTGLLVISGQIFTVLFILLSFVLTRPITIVQAPMLCVSPANQSYWLLVTTMTVCSVVAGAVLLLGFSATYRRRSTDAAHISAQDDYERDSFVPVSE